MRWREGVLAFPEQGEPWGEDGVRNSVQYQEKGKGYLRDKDEGGIPEWWDRGSLREFWGREPVEILLVWGGGGAPEAGESGEEAGG